MQQGIMPIGPLMKEHRVIERLIRMMIAELQELSNTGKPDLDFIDKAVDFLSVYADRCHHGKEEDILFKGLDKKHISQEYRGIMERLIKDHAYGRKTVKALVDARQRYGQGDNSAVKEIIVHQKELIEFYPRHIEIEDKHLFLPCMKYFTKDEQDHMLQEFLAFDAGLIHEKYKSMVTL